MASIHSSVRIGSIPVIHSEICNCMDIFRGWAPTLAQWTEFCKDLKLNNKADISEPTDELNDICVVVTQDYMTWEPMCFVYYIHLSHACNSLQPLQPILQFPLIFGSLGYRTYAVVGYRLFMFGRLVLKKGWTGDWCYYDFRDAINSATTTTLEASDLIRGQPEMKSGKCAPTAAVIGGYKICVFAVSLYGEDEAKKKQQTNFEVLDTRNDSWTLLPEPFDDYRKCNKREIFITSYCVKDSCLIIFTNVGIRGIDIDGADPRWVEMEGSGLFGRSRFQRPIRIGPGQWAMVGENVVSPFEALGWGEALSHPFAPTGESFWNPCGDLGALCSRGDFLCRARGKLSGLYGVPHLMVDSFKFDTATLENLSGNEWTDLKSEKSACFVLSPQECSDMQIIGCYEIMERKATGFRDLEKTNKRKRKRGIGELLEDSAVEDDRKGVSLFSDGASSSSFIA